MHETHGSHSKKETQNWLQNRHKGRHASQMR